MSYKIKTLWIEDDTSVYEAYFSPVHDIIAEGGFIPVFKHYDSIDNITKSFYKEFSNYDIIFSDYQLNSDLDGIEFIRNLRLNNIFTPVILYSAVGESTLRKSIYDGKVDGVYPIDKSLFRERIDSIIISILGKFNEFRSFTGMVMSGVGELECKIQHEIQKILEDQAYHAMIQNTIISFYDRKTLEKNSKIDKYRSNPKNHKDITRDNFIFTMELRIEILKKLINEDLKIKSLTLPFLETVSSKLIPIRNLVAHESREGIVTDKMKNLLEVSHATTDDEFYNKYRKLLKEAILILSEQEEKI